MYDEYRKIKLSFHKNIKAHSEWHPSHLVGVNIQ